MSKVKNFRSYENAVRLNVSHDKRNAIVFDMDGTLSHGCGRSMFDVKKSNTDLPDFSVMLLLQAMTKAYPGVHIIILSGRTDDGRKATEEFLSDYGISYEELFMRKHGDYRQDNIIKVEFYQDHILPFYNVLFHCDDRQKVVNSIRDLGVKVFQVAPGDF